MADALINWTSKPPSRFKRRERAWERRRGFREGSYETGPIEPPVSTDFITTWRTTAPAESITLPLNSSLTHNFTVDWGDGQQDTITAWDQAEATHEYATANTYTVTIAGVMGGFNMFNAVSRLKVIDINNWGSVGLTSGVNMFRGANSLTAISATDAPDLTGVTLLSNFFRDCTGLTSISFGNWDTSTITSLEYFLHGCGALAGAVDLSSFDVSNVTKFEYMMRNCTQVTSLNISGWANSAPATTLYMFAGMSLLGTVTTAGTTIKLTAATISRMFEGDAALTGLDGSILDVAAAVTMINTFSGCTLLDVDVSSWDVSTVTSLADTFLNSAFSQTNYDKLLTAWSAQPVQSAVPFHAGTANYSQQIARDLLTDAPNSWVITDGGAAGVPTEDHMFITTWETTGASETITLPLRTGYSYNFHVDWGDGNTDHITAWDQLEKTHTYLVANTYTVKITGLCQTWSFNLTSSLDAAKIKDVTNWGSIGLTTCGNMFQDCTSLLVTATDKGDFSEVTSMAAMFDGCSALTSIDCSDWDVSKVTATNVMFRDCTSATTLDLSNWTAPLLTNVLTMFQRATATSVLMPNFSAATLTSVSQMFITLNSVTSYNVANWSIPLCTSFSQLFSGSSSLTSIDVSSWDTSAVTDMNSCFDGCTVLTSANVDTWDMSGCTTAINMFRNSPWSQADYDAALLAWSAQPVQSAVAFHAGSAQYSEAAARLILTDPPNSWTITDGGPA